MPELSEIQAYFNNKTFIDEMETENFLKNKEENFFEESTVLSAEEEKPNQKNLKEKIIEIEGK